MAASCIPTAEVERLAAAARAELHAQRTASTPEPRFLNARASLTLDAPRSLVWGGVGYWSPPLGFEDGHRLLAVSSYLADAIRQEHAGAVRSAVQIAAPLLHRALRRSTPPFWRVVRRIRESAAAARAFLHDDPQDVLHLMRWLLHVEDESPATPPDRQITVDLIDNRYAFEDTFKRVPRSWKDYVYGMHHVARKSAREDLRRAVATRIAVNGDKDGWRDYEREMRTAARW
jgi:hypothetical protein